MTQEELRDKIRGLVKVIFAEKYTDPETTISNNNLTRFPQLRQVLTDLMTDEYDIFVQSVEYVAPKPTTFRIVLKNNQDFYLIWNDKSWIAQIEGKKYYLLNLPEEERASQAISRILRYSKMGEEVEEETDSETKIDIPSEEPEL